MKMPPAVTGRPRADSHAAYTTAVFVNGRIKNVISKPAPKDASSGVRELKSAWPACCSARVSDPNPSPKSAAVGMARITEMPANRRKWRRYIRNVSSNRSPISSGRSRSGTDTLTYLNL